MRRPDRLARLTELLARVQANAAERKVEIGSILEARGWAHPVPTAESEPPEPVGRSPREPIPPPPLRRLELASDPDDWSSLLTAELGDPNPPLAAPAQATPLPTPPPPNTSPTETNDDDAGPESQFEHAVRVATEQRPSPPDPRALWLEAAEELRERRQTAPPEPEPDDRQTEKAADVAAVEQPVDAPSIPEPALALTPAPPVLLASATAHDEQSSPAPSRRRRRATRSALTPATRGARVPAPRSPRSWAAVALLSLAALVATLVYFTSKTGRNPEPPAKPDGSALASRSSEPPPTASTHNVVALSSSSSSPEPHPSVATASASAVPDAPPIKRPKDMGLLWVESPVKVVVYVQGFPLGDSGRYLEVPCGMKNVRIARSDPPPPGHSFPMWLGSSQTVLVPCGSQNRIRMAPE